MSEPKKVFFAQNTCINASYDVNVLREGFRRAGYVLADSAEDADEVVFSGCGAHQTWVNDAINQINRIASVSPNAKVTVTGCLAGIDADRVRRSVTHEALAFAPQQEVLKSHTGIDFDEIDRNYDQESALDYEGSTEFNQLRIRVGTEKAAVVAELQKLDREYGLDLEKYYRQTTKGFVFYQENEAVDMITVTRSCPYKCSFCAIPQGRGDYTSVPLDVVVEKVRASLRRGTRRVVLLGDEVGNYGSDLHGPRIKDLLEAILALDPELRVSLRYVEPKPFLKNFPMFERLCGEGRIELLYLPLQSGSQKILMAMNRGYQLDRIVPLYRQLRETTDTIFFCNWLVGFPGETDEDFGATRMLMSDLGLQINTAVPYSERPNTPAPHMPCKIPESVKEQRLIDLRGTIAEMKRREFDLRMEPVAPNRRQHVLDLIAAAECIHVDGFASGASDVASA
ncbi:MAG: radical SAM protein [Methanobacterium sp.]|nr:radical SAM protein [Methanobacterium sp.]